jgi:hypothetical protein
VFTFDEYETVKKLEDKKEQHFHSMIVSQADLDIESIGT